MNIDKKWAMKRKLITICLAVMAAMELVSCGSTTTLTPATESVEVSSEVDVNSKESVKQNEVDELFTVL